MYDVLPDNLDNNSSSIEKSMKRNIRFKIETWFQER